MQAALAASAKQQAAKKAAVPKKAAAKAVDPVAAMQAKYPKLKECAALVKLGLTAADTVRLARVPVQIRTALAFTCIYASVIRTRYT